MKALTEKQANVLRYLSEGKGATEIGELMGVTRHGALSGIFEVRCKLGLLNHTMQQVREKAREMNTAQ